MGVQVLPHLLQPEDFNEGNLPTPEDFEGMGFMYTFQCIHSQTSVIRQTLRLVLLTSLKSVLAKSEVPSSC